MIIVETSSISAVAVIADIVGGEPEEIFVGFDPCDDELLEVRFAN